MFKVLEDLKHKQKGQGIVEYALILAFVVGIAMMLNGSNLGGAVKGVFDDVAAVLSGEEKIDFAAWSKAGKNQLHDFTTGKDVISNEARIRSDQQLLANIGGFFIGKKEDIFYDDNIFNEKGTDKDGWKMILDYQDSTDWSEENQLNGRIKGDKTKNDRIFNWMQGDYGSYNDSGQEIADSYSSSSNYDPNTRYFLSNSMIEQHPDNLASNDKYPNNSSVRVKVLDYEKDSNGNYIVDENGKKTISSVRVINTRGERNNKNSYAYHYELDMTVTKDGDGNRATPTNGSKTGAYQIINGTIKDQPKN